MPGRRAVQLAGIEAPGDEGKGKGGKGDAHGKRIDYPRTVAFVLDQVEQATEQTDDGGQQ
ncbi:hypothetical protein D3C77_797990 [compost metagenome]